MYLFSNIFLAILLYISCISHVFPVLTHSVPLHGLERGGQGYIRGKTQGTLTLTLTLILTLTLTLTLILILTQKYN